jgi:type I restriction enzyme, S subunit
MPNTWNTYKFSELFDISSGLSKSRDQFGHGFPFVTFKNVFYNFFLPDELGDLANTTEKERASGSVRKGDIFLTRTSETLHELGMSSVALKDYPNATFNGFCKRLRLKKGSSIQVDPVFIGYYLRSQNFRNEVTKHATMTTRASLNSTSINTFEVKLPPFEEQQPIGAILRPLDDKIELNLATNRTLEAMAMALYKHWFVDFGPFQHGNFIESELGLIPEGWEVKRLDSVLEIKYGKDHKKLPDGDIPLYGSGGIMRFVNQHLYDQESILIPRKGTLSNLFYLREPFWSVDTMFYSKVKLPNYGKYVFHFLKTTDLASMDVGSAIPSLTTELLNRIELIIPEQQTIDRFDAFVTGWFNQMDANKKENQTLTTLRDTLLPKLISGAVRVKDAERTAAHAL